MAGSMRISDASILSRRKRGFTYLWLLFVIAAGGAAAAALGTHWRSAVQREKELELVFRGEQIAQAIAAYRKASPPGAPASPPSLDALLEDRRAGSVRRHLRRLWTDPFTGRADWELVRGPDEGVIGVKSRWKGAAIRTSLFGAGPGPICICDRIFATP